MTQLIPLQIDENTIIYIEATEGIILPEQSTNETGLVGYGDDTTTADRLKQNFDRFKATLTHYTQNTLSAFKQVGDANVDKVTLKFGIKIAGEAGIPYITKGTAESNLEITVECSFPKA